MVLKHRWRRQLEPRRAGEGECKPAGDRSSSTKRSLCGHFGTLSRHPGFPRAVQEYRQRRDLDADQRRTGRFSRHRRTSQCAHPRSGSHANAVCSDFRLRRIQKLRRRNHLGAVQRWLNTSRRASSGDRARLLDNGVRGHARRYFQDSGGRILAEEVPPLPPPVSQQPDNLSTNSGRGRRVRQSVSRGRRCG
jgi:hypothetical protein